MRSSGLFRFSVGFRPLPGHFDNINIPRLTRNMALPCRRRGGGLLLHFVCFVVACMLFHFDVWERWTLCMVHFLNAFGALKGGCGVRGSSRGKRLLPLAVLWLILSDWVIGTAGEFGSGGQLIYSATELLGLRHVGLPPLPGLLDDVPQHLLRRWDPIPPNGKKVRKRGRRGGVKRRVQRANKLPLPPVILANTRSLRRKMDELRQQENMSSKEILSQQNRSRTDDDNTDKQLIQYTSCPLLAFLDGCTPPAELDLGSSSSSSHLHPCAPSVEAEPPSELLDVSLEVKQPPRSSLIRLEPLTEAEASEETLFYLCDLSPADAESSQLSRTV